MNDVLRRMRLTVAIVIALGLGCARAVPAQAAAIAPLAGRSAVVAVSPGRVPAGRFLQPGGISPTGGAPSSSIAGAGGSLVTPFFAVVYLATLLYLLLSLIDALTRSTAAAPTAPPPGAPGGGAVGGAPGGVGPGAATPVPTPALLPGLLGLGFRALRHRSGCQGAGGQAQS